MSVPVLMDKAIVRHVIRSEGDKTEARRLLTTNKDLSNNMPINSIVAELVGINSFTDESVEGEQRVACIPLLSSHISMPLKRGEAVWLISFQEKSTQGFNYYWISRVHGSIDTEDTNFTAPNRMPASVAAGSNRAYSKSQRIENEFNIAEFPRFDNFIEGPNGDRFFILQTNRNPESELNRVIRQNRMVLEPVPRYFKNEDELVLQGSNNTLIAFKTFDGYSANRSWEENQNISYGSLSKTTKQNDGFIDIVVGRSRFNDLPSSRNFFDINDSNKYQETYTTSSFRTCYPTIINSLGAYENNKNFEGFTETPRESNQEGNPDFNHDASRLCLSENRNLDNFFNINNNIFNNLNTRLPLSQNIASIVCKSDNVRIIARQNVFNNDNISQRSNSSLLLLKEGTYPVSFAQRGSQSYVYQDELGNVAIDGAKIVLGNSLRISENNGDGNQVFIGEEDENSQPMVLGNTLQATLDSLCQQFIDFIEIFNGHGHASTSAIGSAANPGVVGQTANSTSEVTSAINDIKNNLITIQSKMGKLKWTNWRLQQS